MLFYFEISLRFGGRADVFVAVTDDFLEIW